MSPLRDHGGLSAPEVIPIPADLADLLAAIDGPAWQGADALHESLCSYVGDLNANGVPPERTVAIMQRLLGVVPPLLAERAMKRCTEACFGSD